MILKLLKYILEYERKTLLKVGEYTSKLISRSNFLS